MRPNERVGIDHIRVIGEGNLLPGDFNADGLLDAIDIDLLTAAVGGDDLKFDLNSDGFVTDADRDVWVIDLRKTWYGDADMDGLFSSADFVSVFVIGKYEDDVDGNSTWGEGDWDGDGDFTSGDFVRAFVDGGYELGPREEVNAVPEPTTLKLLILAGLLIVPRRRG